MLPTEQPPIGTVPLPRSDVLPSNALIETKIDDAGLNSTRSESLDPAQYTLRKRPWRQYIIDFEAVAKADYQGSGTEGDPFIVQWRKYSLSLESRPVEEINNDIPPSTTMHANGDP